MSNMFNAAKCDWSKFKDDFMSYADGHITRTQLVNSFYDSQSTISTLLDNEVNFNEKPEDEKV